MNDKDEATLKTLRAIVQGASPSPSLPSLAKDALDLIEKLGDDRDWLESEVERLKDKLEELSS